MHPIASRPDRAWLVYAACGFASAFLPVVLLARAGAEPAEVGWFSAWGTVLLLLSFQSWHLARYVPIAKVAFFRYAFSAVAASVVTGGVWLLCGWSIAVLLSGILPSVLPAFRDAWPAIWTVGAMTFFCMLLLTSALDAADQGEAAARRALESDVASREAELRALRAQVDPHFLFNCLHSISSLTSRSAEGARQMCLELADFFRASLRAGAEQRITLDDELQLLRNYLNIEQVRFGDRLRAHVDAAGDAAGVMVPPLLLQPLVENAVRHGIATLIEGGAVSVRVVPSADRVEIVVENPFDPDGRRPGTGVGLTNVRDRLAAAFPRAGVIRVDAATQPAPVFKVTVSIPREGGPA
jgi:hypothetical protein